MNVISVGKHSVNIILDNMREHTLEVNPMHAIPLRKPSMIVLPAGDMREHTQFRNPMNALSVGKLSMIVLPTDDMREHRLERNLMNTCGKTSIDCSANSDDM